MDYVNIVLQLIVAISILNVWLIQYNKPTQWRGGNASNIMEEFAVYGLPSWSCYLVGTLKVLAAIGLILAIWFPILLKPSATVLGVLLMGSVMMHVKIKDPIKKSIPALLFLAICIYLVFAN